MTPNSLIVSVPDGRLRASLDSLPSRVEVIEWDMTTVAPRDRIDMVVTPYVGAVSTIPALHGVRTQLVQSQTLGFDGIFELLPAGSVYANAKSVHESSTAELTLALVLAAQRGIPDFVRSAEVAHWAPAWHPSLADRSVLLVGYGGVGRAIEKRLDAFEVNIVRVATTARFDERGEIHSIDALGDLLPAADIVIVIVPLNAATTHLIDERFLTSMKDGALLVNVSRGPVADTTAVLNHASRGRLRFALDVTDPEPLPEGHSLFSLPNVLITPHVAGASSAMAPRLARLLRAQIERLLAGDVPLNVVFRT